MPRKRQAEKTGAAAKRDRKAATGRAKGAGKVATRKAASGTDGDLRDAIRRRAYELYMARQGTELDDWLQAEREIRGEAE